ncbi:hypothetical protein H4R33_002652 [Dimargaris cristalligena]|nr:hypothetical protein H4R33_002652 [Dimargaris cristalligena]
MFESLIYQHAATVAHPTPNSDDGSIGSINLELIPPHPSTASEHSSDPIRIAEGPLPEFGMFHLGSSSPPNPMSGDPSNPEHSAGLSPSLSPGRGVPQITGPTLDTQGQITSYYTPSLYV